jgi:hypothetical protein
MGTVFDGINVALQEWIAKQHMFFVATAPLDAGGHVNVSPKGPIGTLSVLDEHSVAYLDVIGSGAETIAHVRENGRIVVMLCSFEGPPRILRLHGRGEVVLAGEPAFAGLLERAAFSDRLGPPESRRAIVYVVVERVADSCGYGVPLMSFEGVRTHMDQWAAKKLRVGGVEALRDYQREKNALSIDGLAAVEL